jgi:acyl carrier protein
MSEQEIDNLSQAGINCFVVRVLDRFGDYGLVGAMFVTERDGTLQLQNCLLSCRVLGRRVEHEMFRFLGDLAKDKGLAFVRVMFNPTPKNSPAEDFLNSIQGHSKSEAGRAVYEIPAAALSNVTARESVIETPVAVSQVAPREAVPHSANGYPKLFVRIATQLYDPDKLTTIIEKRAPVLNSSKSEFLSPEGEVEISLAEIWEKILRIRPVGRTDNLFELGGDSLKAIELVTNIENAFNIAFSLPDIATYPVLAAQARQIEELVLSTADQREVELLVGEFGESE